LGGLHDAKLKIKHTVVDGQRLYFDGTGTQLFGNWIKGVLSNHHHVWDLWLLVENQNGAMDCQTHSSCLKIKTASSFRGDTVFFFFG